MAGGDSPAETKKGSSKTSKNSKESTLKQSNATTLPSHSRVLIELN